MSYKASSPYNKTPVVNGDYLDVMTNRDIPKNPNDIFFVINQTYHLRPDLLAYDLYNDGNLWWVFAQRNPNALKDPLFDFVAGKGIYLPQIDTLIATLGI
jgi:hypothetical protein